MLKKILPFISGTSYNIKILLSANAIDYGFFDTYENFSGGTLYSNTYVVTGTSSNRLEELRKYSVSSDYSIKYLTSTSLLVDGLDISRSITTGDTNIFVYYIGGITYTNEVSQSLIKTHFSFTNSGFSTNNFENKPIVKLESKDNVVENPIISSDVFISRQEISVFEKSVRLRAINNLSQVISYAGGNYFKIFENT